MFSDLLGKTLAAIELVQSDVSKNDSITFSMTNGKKYQLTHSQECCESVYIEGIVGELSDLIGSPITLADESMSDEKETRYGIEGWTFYRLATVKGYVDIRWNGSSNGYYSVSVDFRELRHRHNFNQHAS